MVVADGLGLPMRVREADRREVMRAIALAIIIAAMEIGTAIEKAHGSYTEPSSGVRQVIVAMFVMFLFFLAFGI